MIDFGIYGCYGHPVLSSDVSLGVYGARGGLESSELYTFVHNQYTGLDPPRASPIVIDSPHLALLSWDVHHVMGLARSHVTDMSARIAFRSTATTASSTTSPTTGE